MPRTCTICAHPERAVIDQALVAQDPYRYIAARYDTSTGALQRHKQDHLPVALTKAHDAQAVAQATSLLDRLLALSQETAVILREARKTKDHDLALKAIARVEKQIELQARLLGALKDGTTTVNVLVLPQWQRVRGVLLQALSPYPDARQAAALALGALEDGHEPRP